MKKISLAIVVCCFSVGYAQKKSLVDSLKTELLSVSHDTVRVRTMLQLGQAYSMSKPDSAFYFVDQAFDLSNKKGYQKGKINSLTANSFMNREIGNLAQALDYAFKAVALAKQNKLPLSEMRAYNALGIAYLDLSDYKRAISYYAKARKIAVNQKDPKYIYGYDVNTAGAFIKMGLRDSAAFYLERATKNRNTDKPDLFYIRNLGNFETLTGNYDRALSFYFSALEVSVKNGDLRNQASTNNKIAKVYELKKQTDSIIRYANAGLTAAKKGPFRIMILEAATILSKAYESTGDYKNAFSIQKLKEQNQEELYGTNNIKSIQEAILREQKRADEVNQAQVSYKNKLRQYLFTGGLLVLLIVALLLLGNNRQKHKSNKQLSEQKDKIQNTLAELKATQSQLIQSEKMASLGELTAGIAHEIQNPLNFVTNFSDVSMELLDEISEERIKKPEARDEGLETEILADIRQNLEKIAHHGRRADSIVKGMLQHSRASSGEKESTDINALADEYLRLAYHGLRAKDKTFNADLVTHFESGLPKAHVMPQDIGRVLLNLFTNAFYATHKRREAEGADFNPRVEVSTSFRNNHIEIVVKDNGGGIPAAIIDKIFQPFFTTKPTGEGIGLGLSLSYDIVRAHGGTLEADTIGGKETVLRVTLPL